MGEPASTTEQTGLEDVAPQTLDVEGAVAPPTESFQDLGVSSAITTALADAGITHPFAIQAMTLPIALRGGDIIGQAKTGTGKTLGFGIPLLEKVIGPGEPGFDELPSPGSPQALVVAPTRELAVQVAGELEQAGRNRSLRILQVYGGKSYEPQVDALKQGIEVVVGTPGRLLDLMKQRHLELRHVTTVVLDEADEMLDLGFLADVETLLASTAANRQTMLFSATMPGPVITLARRYMNKPTHVRVHEVDDTSSIVKSIRQFAYRAHSMDKVEVLTRILQARGRGLTIVFSRTKRTASKVVDELQAKGFAAAAIHGDLGQGAREQALRAFRNGKVDVLVATDVAARGIDVDDVTHVINYQCPDDEKTYVHRVGRTGRAGKNGVAVTFVDWDEIPRWNLISRALQLDMTEPVETYSTSDHLFTDLDIDPTVTGRLPRAQRTREGLDAEEIEDLGEPGSDRGGRRSRSSSGNRSAAQSGDKSGGSGGSRRGSGQGRSRSRNGDQSSAAGGDSDPSTGQGRRSRGDDATSTPPATGGARRRRPRRRTRGGQDVSTDASRQSSGSDPQ